MLNLDESSEALHRNLKEKEKENRNLERRYRNEKSDLKTQCSIVLLGLGFIAIVIMQKKIA